MYVSHTFGRRFLATSVALAALAGAGQVFAADAAVATNTGPGSTTTTEGVEVHEVVVSVEANKAAAAAPTKGNLKETQPESIITHKFIELATPETGNYTTTMLIAPSLSGITSNGGGVGEYNKIVMRGFQDGQYNLTYDGIFFGDTNNPSHHPASFFPSSTIGAVAVDRGPGAAGDLGQSNYGGAIHLFSPDVADKFGVSQKVTYGSFNTQGYVTTLQSGAIDQLGGTKVLLNLDERTSDGELSYSSGEQFNQMLKIVTPFGDRFSLTGFVANDYSQYYQSDVGTGETYAQLKAFGIDHQLNNDPRSADYFGYNNQKKRTIFSYLDFKGDLGLGFTVEDQLYHYYYTNSTYSPNNITGVTGPDMNGLGAKANVDAPYQAGLPSTDVSGYNKLNEYNVTGDVLRVNKDLGFGTLKVGGVVETSDSNRHVLQLDFTQGGVPDERYKTGPAPKNAQYIEGSSWNQYQLFADFEWRPLTNLTITPGFKWVDLTRSIAAPVESSGVSSFSRAPVYGSNEYTKPLYFLTANYRIRPYWSVYGQYATGFLIPPLSTLYVSNTSINQLKPQESVNYQFGSVYTRGHITADADVYTIKLTNFFQVDPTGTYYYNAGDGRFSGVEGEFTYAFDIGLSLFANGSLNSAELTSVPGGAPHESAFAPKWTDAVGALYARGPWQGTVTFKEVGAQAYYNDDELKPYNTLNAALAYDFGRFKIKLAGFNLADRRSVVNYTGKNALWNPTSTGFYQFEAGRELQVTLQAKF